ncbi:MAG: hypothetical protein ACE5JI_16330, partial [Acidobacteriota bacterium]
MTRPGTSPFPVEGLLELDPQGVGRLRQAQNNYLPMPADVRVPGWLIEQHHLKEGHYLTGAAV